MKSKVLYLLVNVERTAFKMGISFSPYRRIAEIPHNIAIAESYEVRFMDNSAKRAELVMHHLFRHRRFEMPRGDGYTEWFEIEALQSAIRFIKDQSGPLGVREIGKLRPQLELVDPSDDAADIQARNRLWRSQERARQLAEKYENARRTNEESLGGLRTWLSEIEATGSFGGILRAPQGLPGKGGYLYLKGKDAMRLAERSLDPNEPWSGLTSPFGFMRIFCGYRKMGSLWTEISVNSRFLAIEPIESDYQTRFPGSEAVRLLLAPRAAALHSHEERRLQKVHDAVEAADRAFMAAFERAWWDCGQGVAEEG